MKSKKCADSGKSASKSRKSKVECAEKKRTFGLQLYPKTLETVDAIFEHDNCGSRSEFIEKAVQFYCGYLMNAEHAATEFLAPQLATITEGIVKGSEQRLSRAMFKIAVELGAVSHMLAAINDINDETLFKLRAMCTDEIKRINGIISFENAVRYQRAE